MEREHLFPTLSTEDYTKEGQPIYGGSIGMNKVYDNLVKMAGQRNPHPFRVIIVNALTLIRNNYDPSYKILQEKAQKDLTTLTTYLSVYLRNTKDDKDPRKVSIIVMYPDYKKLPEVLRRVPTAQMKRITEMYIKDVKDIKDGLDKFFSNDVLQIFSFKGGDRVLYPHQSLQKFLIGQIAAERRGTQEVPYRVGDPIHLLSHVTLDWHISEIMQNVSLLESFTGEIITAPYFGSKLIKRKDIKVPFNSVIHQTFGDDTLIKPLAVRANKNKLLDSAKKWSMMTSTRISQIISETLSLPISTLTKYKFV